MLYGTTLSIFSNIVKNVVNIHIDGDRAIFLLFCNHQHTESESWEMKIGLAGPIIKIITIKGSMGQLYIYSTRWEENILVILPIYGDRAIFLLFCNHQESESE